MLTPAFAAGDTTRQPAQRYVPLRECPALFRTFADTLATEDGVLQFARRFGMLGGSAAVGTDAGHPITVTRPEAVGGTTLEAEPLTEWLDRIFSMRQAIALWEMVSARDVDGLRHVIVCDQDAVRFQPKAAWLRPDWRVPEPVRGLPEGTAESQGEQIKAAAPFILSQKGQVLERFRRMFSLAMLEAAAAALHMITNRFLRGAVESRLEVDGEVGKAYLVQEPDNLGGALWLQFAQAVTAGTRFRVCKECGEWFALPLRGARITREYCTDACRIRAYRGRQERARALAAEGKEPREIARELDTTASVVRKWLKSGKGN
jgi:hypothetical protein